MIAEYLLFPLFILAMIVSLSAQIKVQSTFKKYSRVKSGRGYTAEAAARRILDANGLYNVRIERVRGNLTDHYDPRANVLRLSDSVYSSNSVAAVGVAAHEAGHAVQHAVGYLPIRIRSALVPVTSFASRISWIVILLGVMITAFAEAQNADFGYNITLFGIGLFSTTALFQLVTLPCEFDASARAMKELAASGVYTEEELAGSRKVLSAAAMTYVAALFVSVIQILRLILIFTGGRRRK